MWGGVWHDGLICGEGVWHEGLICGEGVWHVD